MKPTRPALRYHGGKWKIAPWIISNFPAHRIYVEPFGGAASVLLRKPRAYSEVYNDIWGTVVNVFRVLRDKEQSEQLRRLLELTPFSRAEFETCGEEQLEQITDPVEKARRTIFRSFAGFGSASTNAKYSTGFRACSNRSGTTPGGDWLDYPGHLPEFVERLRGVLIECRPALEVIAQHDTPETLIYCDPPYPHSTRNLRRGNANYAYEMSDADHARLAKALKGSLSMVVISGYACDLYDLKLYKKWKRVEKQTYADGARDRTECLWLNKAAANRRPQGMFNDVEVIP